MVSPALGQDSFFVCGLSRGWVPASGQGEDLLDFCCHVLKCPQGLCVLDSQCDWAGLSLQKSPGQNHKWEAITSGHWPSAESVLQNLGSESLSESAWAPICLPAS